MPVLHSGRRFFWKPSVDPIAWPASAVLPGVSSLSAIWAGASTAWQASALLAAAGNISARGVLAMQAAALLAGAGLFGEGTDPWASLDGRQNAPVGTIQFPTLLNGYHPVGTSDGRYFLGAGGGYQPPWHVAGVDYPVGCPTNITLKDPNTGTLPPGVTRDTTNKIFTVTASNVVIDGWDFTLNGGWTIEAGRASGSVGSNLTIQNCSFLVGSLNQQPISILGIDNFGSTAQIATIQYCTFMMNGTVHDIGGRAAIECSRSGLLTLLYNYIDSAPTDFWTLGADLIGSGRPTTIDMRYNLFRRNGQNPAGHSDWIQTAEVASGTGKLYDQININFNCVIQDSFPAGGGSQGFTLDANTKANYTQFGGGGAQNNTVIITATDGGTTGVQGYATRVALDCTNGNWTMSNNFIDPTTLSPVAASQAWKTSVGSGPFTGHNQFSTGNINMTNGAAFNNPASN